MNATQKLRTFVIVGALLGLGACGEREVPSEEQPRYEFEEPENCESVEGVVEASDAGKAEDVAEVAYRVVQNSSRIEFEAIGRSGDVVGVGSIVYDVPATIEQEFVSTTTFTDDSGTAEEISTTRFLGNIASHKTVKRANGLESFLLWTQGPDGLVIDATMGIETQEQPDGEKVFALPEGNFALLHYVKASEQIKNAEEVSAFVGEFGLDVLEASQAFRRMHVLGSDEGWLSAMNLQIAVCQGYAASTFAGPVDCSSGDAFNFVIVFENVGSVVVGGALITGGLVAAGVIGTTGAAIGATFVVATIGVFIADKVITDLVKNNAEAAAPSVQAAGERANELIPTVFDFDFFDALDLGDPHLTSLDGLAFDLQSAGEIILTQSLAGDFELQSRQSPLGSSICGDVTYNTAFALRIGQTRIQFEFARDIPLSVDGSPVTPFTTPIEIGDGVYVVQSDAGYPIIAAPTGELVYIAAGRSISIKIPSDRAGQYEGILGNGNGNPDDDFVSISGLLTQPVDWSDIHGQFVDRWRVDEETSLFVYEAGEGPDTFYLPGFPGGVSSIDSLPLELRAEAEQRCSVVENPISFQNCVFDVGCSGDNSFVEDHLIGDPKAEADISTEIPTIDQSDLVWGHSVEGVPIAPFVFADGSLTLTLSFVDGARLNALSSQKGRRLWQKDGLARCKPVVIGDRVVAQLDPAESNAVVLLDSRTGIEIDRLELADGNFRECTEKFEKTAGGRIIMTNRNVSYGIDLNDDQLTLAWTSNYLNDPVMVGAAPRGDTVVLDDTLYLTALKAGLISVYSINTVTGAASAEFITTMTLDSELQKGAEDLLVLTGSRSSTLTAYGIRTSSNTMVEAWSRDYGTGVADGITRTFGNIAIGPNGFASWVSSEVEGALQSGVAEFDVQTGLALWFAQASSFDNNGEIVALADGAYAISPFGSENFIEAYRSGGDFGWSIPYPEGTNFPSALVAAGPNRVVLISSLNGRSTVVSIDPLR